MCEPVNAREAHSRVVQERRSSRPERRYPRRLEAHFNDQARVDGGVTDGQPPDTSAVVSWDVAGTGGTGSVNVTGKVPAARRSKSDCSSDKRLSMNWRSRFVSLVLSKHRYRAMLFRAGARQVVISTRRASTIDANKDCELRQKRLGASEIAKLARPQNFGQPQFLQLLADLCQQVPAANCLR
jgi:hypothetical protein